ncbi:MAG: ShlB/FhaC/HecB family hemolysin secretion/activation protein [Gammaproteobacteria bacterium]|nr:ShlB/FhaC/HecB family hemolysin secretion/activation protein [Gammaproteobacteria bacterium]
MQPPAPGADVFAVPPVIDRPLDIDEGEKIVVQRFELDNVVERPEFGITLDQLQAIVEAKRAERPEGFTVGRLQEVATAVTQFYRAQGLILAQAYIPTQDVADGIVHVAVLEGRLGRVLTEGNKQYSAKLLEQPFESLIDQPVTKEQMEQVLLSVTDYPGVSLFGVFQPGQLVGTADLVLKVQDERRVDARVTADNHGLPETGQRRYRLEVDINNVTKAADKLSLTTQFTARPRDAFFWRAAYERPLWFDPSYKLSASFDENKFDVLGAFRKLQSWSGTRNAHLALEKTFIRSRQRNLYGKIDLARKRALTKQRGREQSVDNLTELALEVNYDSVDARFAGLNFAQLQLTHGFNELFGAMGGQGTVSMASVPPSRRGESGRFATGDFDKLFLSYQRLQALSIISEKLAQHSMLLRLEGQYSSDLLTPLEQFSIGGPTSVRAFQPAEALFDKGYFASLEWIINAPLIHDRPSPFGNRTWGELLRLHLFYDRAYGVLNDPLPSENESQLYDGAGFAISFDNPNEFSFRITLAHPIFEPQPQNGKDPQAWVDLTWIY